MKTHLSLLQVPLAMALAAAHAPAAGQSRFDTIYTFNGGLPLAISRVNGVLYGAFQGKVNGAYTCGSIFALEPEGGGPSVRGWNETTIYAFPSGGDACAPTIAPVPGPAGALYGLAGALYELQAPAEVGSPWTETVDYGDVAPVTGLANGPAGSFYLLNDASELLQLSPPSVSGGSWTATDLFNFPAGPQLAPNSLIAGPNGTLYGTSELGGYARGQYGAVFQLTPPSTAGGDWSLKILHSFGSGTGSGGNPVALTLASDGTLYGVTCGAASNCSFIESGNLGEGVAFQLTPPASGDGAWAFTVLANFGPRYLDSPLVERNGNLFGTYESSPGGALFELEKPPAPGGAWTVKYLHRFTNGQVPFGPLIMDENGVLYGTTGSLFDTVQTGTVYRIDTQ